MKKRSLFAFVAASILALTMPAITSAASVGNPDTVGESGVIKLSIEHDRSHTNMALKHGNINDGPSINSFGSSNMQLKSETTYGVITVGILPSLDAFAGLGTAKSNLGFDMTYPESGSDSIVLRDNSNLAYKVGVRGKITEVGDIQIVGSAQYSAYKTDEGFTVNGQDLASIFYDPASYRTKTKVRELQAALTASKRMGRFSPYVGVIASKVSAKHDTVINVAASEGPAYSIAVNAEAKQESPYSAVIGTGVDIMKNLNANVEFRSGNQDAFTAALSYTF